LRELPPNAHARRIELLRKIVEIDPADAEAAAQLQTEEEKSETRTAAK
jgi:hypothetical protein